MASQRGRRNIGLRRDEGRLDNILAGRQHGRFAENGTAMNWAPKEGWKDFREIWLPAGPDDFGPNVNAADLDNEGDKLCAMNGK